MLPSLLPLHYSWDLLLLHLASDKNGRFQVPTYLVKTLPLPSEFYRFLLFPSNFVCLLLSTKLKT